MNPANFNAGGAMPGMVKPAQIPPPKPDNTQVIMNHVAQALQNQGTYTGWKAEVPIKIRAMNVYQMITSLRLIQPRIDLQQAAQAALAFEQKAFQKAEQKVDYDHECNEKLLHIKDTRQRQAAVAYQSGMMPQGGAMQTPNHGGFPQQMTRNMQTPGQQQQMMMGMNDPSQQAAMQQRQHQQQQSAMLQQQQQQQRTQQRPGNGVPLPDDLNTLSAQELDHVSRLATQMLSKTSPEDMEKIKLNLSNMTPEQRQYLARKNMDPMTYFFRSQALNQLRRHRRARMEMGRAPNAGVEPNGAMMGDPMINPQQRQTFQNMMQLQRNSAYSGNQGQNLDSNAFIGNVENIQVQQADGLRSQEAGQLVVPASSSQMNQHPFGNSQNMFSQSGPTNMSGANVNPQFLAQQQHLQNNSSQFQTPQAQAQAQAQARAQAAQKAQMAMSGHGGQANPSQAQLPQQSPVMPMLNQPMAPGQISPAQIAAQARPPSRPPNMGQHPAGNQGQPAMQGRPQIPPGLPPAVQEQLSQMTNEQLNAFLINQRRIAMGNNMARAGNAPQQASIQQNLSQPGQGQAMLAGQMGNNAQMRGAMNMPQGMAPGALHGQQLSAQQQQQQRQNELYKLQILRAHNNGMEMTPEQTKEMDRTQFPASILNSNPSPVPKHIRTWGQLKQWAASNPQVSGVDLPKLMRLQTLHLAQILSAQVKDPNSHAAGMAANAFSGPSTQMPNAQGFPPGKPQPPMNMPAMRPITAQDIQIARQKLGPQSSTLSDEQIRELLNRNRQKHLIQAAQRAAQFGGNMPPNQQTQPAPHPPISAPQPGSQAKPPTAPQQAQPAAGAQGPEKKTQTSTAKGAKATAGKQAAKKRPLAEDAGTAATTQPTQPAGAAAPAAPSKPNFPFSREQLAAMTPQQRAQIETQMRKQQGQTRGPILSRAAAEEAWNKNLPPKVMEVYSDISRSAPPSEPKPVSPEQKAVMSQQLRDSLDVLGRLDTLVQWFAKMPGQEKNVRNLLAMRIQLMRQFKPTQDWMVNDQFTITPDYLTGAILFIRKLFQGMIAHVSKQQNQASGQRPNASQATTQTSQASMAPLNATNLQQLQQQEEALQRARRASSQSANLPAPFGAPSPQGVPHAYGPGGLAPEKLKLPPLKKRKQSHAGPMAGSPIRGASAAPAAAAKLKPAAEAKSAAAALAGTFKCAVAECQYHSQGFSSQAALDKHVEENHQPEENIDNPLQYALDSFAIGLGTKPAAIEAAKPGAAPAKPSVTSSPAKQGISTPATGTPAARVNQLGAKTASPAVSAQQLTPRQPSGKGGVSGLKASPGKDDKKEAGKAGLEDTDAKDAWADCPISLETLHDTFSSFQSTTLPSLGYDPFEEFMNAEMFSASQAEDTPISWDVALATLTPETETKEPVLVNDFALAWDDAAAEATAAWIDIPLEIQNNDADGIKGVRIDWELLENQKKEMSLDGGGITIPAM